MGAVWIVGAGTDVGKTFIACALIRALRTRGEAVDALKPVVSGFDPAAPEDSDPARLLEALGRAPTPEAIAHIAPFRFRAPLSPPLAARLEGRALDHAALAQLCRERAAAAIGTLVIETAGGVMSPVDEAHSVIDLLPAVAGPVVLVGGSYLGAISHALTAIEALRHRRLELAAVVISESAESTPLDDVATSVRSLSGGLLTFAAPRSPGGWDAAPLRDRLPRDRPGSAV